MLNTVCTVHTAFRDTMMMRTRSNSFLVIGTIGISAIFSLAAGKKNYSPFKCVGPAWNVTAADSTEAEWVFQKWLRAWPNDCSKQRVNTTPKKGGLGSSFHTSVIELLNSIEMGRRFQWTEPWLWAGNDPMCSLGIPTLDCFSQPMSYCGFENKFKEVPSTFIRSDRFVGDSEKEQNAGFSQAEADMFSKVSLDSCSMGMKLKVRGYIVDYCCGV
jgi:hypothetical protein